MDFTLEINLGVGDVVKYNTCDFWKVVALASFVENMEEIAEIKESTNLKSKPLVDVRTPILEAMKPFLKK